MDGLHVAIVPDGNRRWARSRDRSALEGHEQGAEQARAMAEWMQDRPVDEMTLWGLSYDNFRKRSDDEVAHLNRIFADYADDMRADDSPVHEEEIRVRVVGRLEALTDEAQAALRKLEDATAGYSENQLNVALAYDGRREIVDAVNAAVDEAGTPVDASDIEQHLQLPEVDILLGYGGDRAHLSHFANWQVGYATLYFPGKHWPAAEEADVDDAIAVHRDRKKSRGK